MKDRVANQGNPVWVASSAVLLSQRHTPFDVAAVDHGDSQHVLGLQPLLRGIDRLRRLEGALRQLTRPRDLIHPGQGAGEGAEDLGADLAGKIAGQQRLGLLEHGESFAVTGEIDEQRGPAHEQRGAALQCAVVADLGQRLVDQGQSAIDRPGPGRRRRRRLEQLGMADPGPLFCAGHLGPQLEGAFEMALGGRRRSGRGGGPSGPD